jgi:hypothetical protein
MQTSKVLLSCVIGNAPGNTASAQVCQSRNVQGNAVFSDQPSQGVEELNLPRTNPADPASATSRPAPPANKTDTLQNSSPGLRP